MKATQTITIQALQLDWEATCGLPALAAAVRGWTSAHEGLARRSAADVIALLTADCRRELRLRDEALNCVIRHVDDPLSQKLVLRSLLPQLVFLINTLSFPAHQDLDEHAASVVAVAAQFIADFQRTDITYLHWWLYRSIKREVMRGLEAQREWLDAELEAGARVELAGVELAGAQGGGNGNGMDSGGGGNGTDGGGLADGSGREMDEMISLASKLGEIDRMAAATVVLTRSEMMSIAAMAEHSGVSTATLRKRRVRAEKMLRERLSELELIRVCFG